MDEGDPFRDTLSFVMFTVFGALLAVLVWALLRWLRRGRLMRDQETMTMGEPSLKPPSTADTVSAAGVCRKDSAVQTSAERVLQPLVGVVEAGASAVATPPAASPGAFAGSASSSPGGVATAGSAETMAESKSSPKAQPDQKEGAAVGATSKLPLDAAPSEFSQPSGLKRKSKRRRTSVSKSGPEGVSKLHSRRDSVQRSPPCATKSSSSSEPPLVPALLIRRPSTNSRSSQRSNRSTRYVVDVPKVPPPLDVFSREHSSMVESPPSKLTQSPPADASPAYRPGS